ncbi:MAG: radical SAM/Cys-rich domain protein [Gammaproteobacteria bacterium]|nr:radical SAM/Cys-rich domain protein [Gammaproteobacteria bacterium]
MLETSHLLLPTSFPQLTRSQLQVLQVNLGYLCNQSCNHCHVNAGPKRTELMSRATIDEIIRLMDVHSITTIDLTGGAPELNPEFRYLVSSARELGVHVMDRCNLSVLLEPGQEGLAGFLAENQVEVVASLPCYLQENVDSQRGSGAYTASMAGLQQLNQLGYGQPNSGLTLNLVYNPLDASLPPPQQALEADYKARLMADHGVSFDQLLTITNMPISRFGSMLASKGEFQQYMVLLKDAFQEDNLQTVMCRSLLSVDWQGYLYDCDFNQMLKMPLDHEDGGRAHISHLSKLRLQGLEIKIADHCYGCTAGQGSSCGGALA